MGYHQCQKKFFNKNPPRAKFLSYKVGNNFVLSENVPIKDNLIFFSDKIIILVLKALKLKMNNTVLTRVKSQKTSF